MWLHAYHISLAQAGAGRAETPGFDLNIEKLNQCMQQLGVQEWLVVPGAQSVALYLASNERESESSSFAPRVLEALRHVLNEVEAPLEAPLVQHGMQAVTHFFRAALGWQPNDQIDAQQAAALRKAFVAAQDSASAGVLLNRLYHRALWLSEKVRSETSFFEGATSLAPAILEVAGKIFGDLRDRQVLIIGAVAEAMTTAQALQQARLGKLFLLASDAREEKQINKIFPLITAIPWDDNSKALPHVDLILLLSDYGPPLTDKKFMQKLMAQRQHAPLLLVDLAHDAGAGRALTKIDNLFFFARADLNRLLAQNLQSRVEVEQRVAGWIAQEAAHFFEWANSAERFHFGAMVGSSAPMQKVFELIARLARTDITVLIQGESGTGKELVARAIHDESPRARQPFVVVNCGAIPENLLESELFGHVRGAFTGALRDKKGLFEEAHGGTIFLDEISELPIALQVKLLRFLQEGEIKRVGSNNTTMLDVRVLAATNRNLLEMVEQGKFRSDLYYRLNVIQIDLPPLRERREDVLPLARFFLQKFATRLRKPGREFTAEALSKLKSHDWPGNVRELENAIERAVALSTEREIGLRELPEALHKTARSEAQRNGELTLEEVEKRHILATLAHCQGNYDEAARVLAIGRTTLWRKLKKYQESDEQTARQNSSS